MKNYSYYRAMARESLSGRWTGAVLATLLTFVLQISASFCSSLFTNPKMMTLTGISFSASQSLILAICVLFLILLVVQPLSFAYTYSFLRLRRTEYSIWTCMKVSYGKAILAPILYGVIIVVAAFLSSLVMGLIALIFRNSVTLTVIMMGLMFIPFIIYMGYVFYSFLFYPMFVVDNADKSLYDSFVLCYRMIKGERMNLFLLDISFIGWYLLNIPTLGLATLCVRPYHYAARAAFYEDLIAKNKNEI